MKRRTVQVGEIYGELSVVGQPFTGKSGHKRVLCHCSCGVTRDFVVSKLCRGMTKSCGHLSHSPDAVAKRTQPKHGFGKRCIKRIPEYNAWVAMKQRCLNPKNPRYKHYGGRGITICEQWLDSFPQFLNDMGMKPAHQLSIDRINNDGNYEPSNCRWATIKEQHANQRYRRKNSPDTSFSSVSS